MPKTAIVTPLGHRLAARIARLGPITVADYMAEVLTDPEAGYYMTGDPFGLRGDFVTAPEISQMFGELIGLWCADTWDRLGRPDPLCLVELGPGRGTLMADALRALCVVPECRAALRPHLVEISPALRARQEETLASAGVDASWHERLGEVPEGALLLIANEFFDALPIRQFERRPEGWCERLVALNPGGPGDPDGKKFAFALGPPGRHAAALLPPTLREAPLGAVVEVSAPGIAIATEIGRRLATHGGGALIVDYGHSEPRSGATLQAVRRHAAHHVLEEPGSADLTAHVDFTTLARAASDAGARTHGPVCQGQLLETLGIAARAETLRRGATPARVREIDAARHRLTDAAEMGTLFKALALSHPDLETLAGFELS
jgi:NADH dehydrogenase [ubiquinone] 1 alpha subcomplex assembly factor 7